MGNIESNEAIANEVANMTSQTDVEKRIDQVAPSSSLRRALAKEISEQIRNAEEKNIANTTVDNLRLLRSHLESRGGLLDQTTGAASATAGAIGYGIGFGTDVSSRLIADTGDTLKKNADAMDVFRGNMNDGNWGNVAFAALPILGGYGLYKLHKKMMGKDPSKTGGLRKFAARATTAIASVLMLRAFADWYVPDEQTAVPDFVELT